MTSKKDNMTHPIMSDFPRKIELLKGNEKRMCIGVHSHQIGYFVAFIETLTNSRAESNFGRIN